MGIFDPLPLRRTTLALGVVAQSNMGNVSRCVVTASISGTTMTVSGVGSGVIEVGALVEGYQVAANTVVQAQLTGSAGSTGTYTVSQSQSVSSRTLQVNVVRAFKSLYKPGATAPLPGALSPLGGPLHRVIDELWTHGYDARIFNGRKGSMGLIRDGCGYLTARASSSNAVFQRRAAVPGSVDRGFFGDIIAPSGGPVWVCTTGRSRGAMHNGVMPPWSGTNVTAVDYMIYGNETPTTAGSDPGSWAGAAVGDTKADGTVNWQCISVSAPADYGSGSIGTVMAEGQKGWDPLGVLAATWEGLRDTPAEIKMAYIDGNQGDLYDTSGTWRRNAVKNAATYFLSRGVFVLIGNQRYSSGSGNQTVHETQNTANAGAISDLQAGQYAGRVFAGADLYTGMGGTSIAAADTFSDNIHFSANAHARDGGVGVQIANSILNGPLNGANGFVAAVA